MDQPIPLPLFRCNQHEEPVYADEIPEWGVWRTEYHDHGGEG